MPIYLIWIASTADIDLLLQILPLYAREPKLQGLKMGLEGKGLMKASDVHRSMSLNKIETALRAGLKVTKGIDINRKDRGISL